jgi:hypothetical protein
MSICNRLKYQAAILALAASALLPAPAAAQATQAGEKWQFTGSIYGYFPTVGGTTSFPTGSGGADINVSSDKIIDSLNGAFMGTLGAHNGRWGAFADVIYLDIGGSKSQTRDFSIGNAGIPAGTSADLNLNLKGWIWTLAGQYRVAADPAWTVDVLAGARLLDLRQKLDWGISGNLGSLAASDRTGSSEVSKSLWDGIVGVKGRYALGAERKWSVPFYLDAGTGQSDRTLQAAIGVAYAFQWGEIGAVWRYLEYKLKSGSNIQDMSLNGPMIGAVFHW